MRVNNYLSVCMFQLKTCLECNSENEYLIETSEVFEQMETAFSIIEKYQPDISLFPEMSYLERYEEMYKKLSVSKIIVAGSYYKEGINTTVIFSNGEKHEISKGYASGAEPMARKVSFIQAEEFLQTQLKQHEFWIKGKKIYILNCISTYQNESYGDGKSYIYGPISIHEKEWLREEGIESKKNVCHILSLSSEKAQYVYGKFVFPENLSKFGRSDNYLNNPRDVKVLDL